MKYILLFHGSQAAFDLRTDPEKEAAYWSGFSAYIKAIHEAGIVIAGAGLQVPEKAKMVRVRDGKHEVHDGPYAETKESLAGFFLIEVPDEKTAVDWAVRCPWATHSPVEVRPVMLPEEARIQAVANVR